MPRPGFTPKKPADPLPEWALQEKAEFENPARWARSKSKPWNTTRRWEEKSVTIFYRRGQYGWCINTEDEDPRFSCGLFESREDALSSLAAELGVGEC